MNDRDELRSLAEEWKSTLTRSASALDDFVDVRMRQLRRRLGREGVPRVHPYIGMAGPDEVFLIGRVLTNPPLEPNYDRDRWMHNVVNAYRRFASNEVPGIAVTAELGSVSETLKTDAEGYFRFRIPRPDDWGNDGMFSTVSYRIEESRDRIETMTTAEVITPGEEAKFGVISDVDDTIMHTGATELTTMAKLTFFGNAKTRAPLDGVARLYRLLQNGGDLEGEPIQPIFYVSSSPWNLFDLLIDFLELNDIPRGPLMLRDLGIDHDKFIKNGHDHKLDKITSIVGLYPELPFVLFGDSGQEDARLYAAAVERHPGRIQAIFIRDIDASHDTDRDQQVMAYAETTRSLGVPMHLVGDSDQAAEHLVSLGLLPQACLPSVARETAKDRHRVHGAMTP